MPATAVHPRTPGPGDVAMERVENCHYWQSCNLYRLLYVRGATYRLLVYADNINLAGKRHVLQRKTEIVSGAYEEVALEVNTEKSG
jgi:hypothetical protein